MNYLKIYIKICRRAKNRKLKCYTENHHIFPQCIFGKNKTTVKLTAKEHYVVHFLLFKLAKKRYGLNHWKTHKLGYAYYMMTKSDHNQQRYYSKTYEIAKKWYSTNNPSKYRDLSGKNNPMYGKIGKLHPLYGIPCSNETKRKIGLSNKGKLSGDNNPSKREDVRKKISDSWKTRDKLTRNKNKQSKLSEDQVLEIIDLWKNEKLSGMSGYRFCKEYHSRYNVKYQTIGNIIYKYEKS